MDQEGTPPQTDEKQTGRVVICPISLFEDFVSSVSERQREMEPFVEGLCNTTGTIMMTTLYDRDIILKPSRPG